MSSEGEVVGLDFPVVDVLVDSGDVEGVGFAGAVVADVDSEVEGGSLRRTMLATSCRRRRVRKIFFGGGAHSCQVDWDDIIACTSITAVLVGFASVSKLRNRPGVNLLL